MDTALATCYCIVMQKPTIVEDVARQFFFVWRTYRLGQGWTLGHDRPDAKMSPYLVHSWEALAEDGRVFFLQQAAMVLHATKMATGIDPLHTHAEKKVSNSERTTLNVGVYRRLRAIAKLETAMEAIDVADVELARIKVRTAIRLLRGKKPRKG